MTAGCRLTRTGSGNMGPTERAALPQTQSQARGAPRNGTWMSADTPENARLAQATLSSCATTRGSARAIFRVKGCKSPTSEGQGNELQPEVKVRIGVRQRAEG